MVSMQGAEKMLLLWVLAWDTVTRVAMPGISALTSDWTSCRGSHRSSLVPLHLYFNVLHCHQLLNIKHNMFNLQRYNHNVILFL